LVSRPSHNASIFAAADMSSNASTHSCDDNEATALTSIKARRQTIGEASDQAASVAVALASPAARTVRPPALRQWIGGRNQFFEPPAPRSSLP
jgi:hypothetical protein